MDAASGEQPSEILAEHIYAEVVSLSSEIAEYKTLVNKPDLLKRIKESLTSLNRRMNCELTEQGRDCLAALVVTSPEIVKSFVVFADVLFSGMVLNQELIENGAFIMLSICNYLQHFPNLAQIKVVCGY